MSALPAYRLHSGTAAWPHCRPAWPHGCRTARPPTWPHGSAWAPQNQTRSLCSMCEKAPYTHSCVTPIITHTPCAMHAKRARVAHEAMALNASP
eukprot:126986-Chlamydomonas_euryale.AAC.12